ncbi:MAG: PHB depolymerase family esterase [Maribacter sp.]
MKIPRTDFSANYTKSNGSWILLIVSFLLIFLNSCLKDTMQEDTLGEYNVKTLNHDGIERTYRVYLPSIFEKTKPTPIVFALHGGGGTGANFEKVVSSGTLTAAAEAKGVILVMPDGIDKKWNSGRSEIFADGSRSYDDVGFISRIIDVMIQNYGADASRVYSTGISAGGFMSVRLALDLSEKLAAIAPVTAQLSQIPETTMPSVPMSIMIINGTDDPLVPYEGGCITVPGFAACSRGSALSTQETIDKFTGYNQCVNLVETEPIIDALPNDGTSVEITRSKDCNQGTEVVLVKVIGGGHTWPSGAQYLPASIVGPVSNEINASEMILDFFLSHSRN